MKFKCYIKKYSFNGKESSKGRKMEQKRYKTYKKQSKMVDTNPTISIITLNVNGITTQEKGKNWHTELKNRIQLYAFFRGDTLYIQGKASHSVVSNSL